ncbi:MAG: VOC family protein [bacterium]
MSVADLDGTVKWYQENLGFVVRKKIDLPKYSLRMAFAELNGFQLELIEFKGAVLFERIQKQFPDVDDREKIQGLGKLALFVEDLRGVAKELKGKGVKFIREPTDDKEFRVRYFIVTDNSGNWLQFFQKLD